MVNSVASRKSAKVAESKANAQVNLFKRLNEKLSTVGAIQPFEQSVVAKPRTWLLSDMPSLNWVLGHGIPFGCLWELCGAEGAGKALPLATPVLTPTGWRPIGELKIGDTVCCPYGGWQDVIGVYQQGVRPVYKVTFSDKTYTYCDEGHLWKVKRAGHANAEWRILSLAELLELGIHNGIEVAEKRGVAPNNNWCIPSVSHLMFKEDKLPIPAYVLGVLIGDGSLVGNIAVFSCPDYDTEIVERVTSLIPEGYHIHCDRAPSCPRYLIEQDNKHGKQGYIRFVKELGLNVYSSQKFIPHSYLFASEENRKALLAGLMDTDGHAGRNGSCRFSTSSQQLAKDVVALVQSLGGLAKISYSPQRPDGKCEMWTVNVRTPFNPFLLKRKAERYSVSSRGITRYIANIERVEDAETVCIRVSGPDETYVINDYIVTHNSTLAYSLAASLQKSHGALVIPYAVEALDDSMFARTGLDPAYMQLPADESLESIDSITTNMMLILQQIEEMNEEGSYDADYPLPVIMIWDSIAATATSKVVDVSNNSEEKSSVTREQMGATASQLTVALKKLLPMFSKANTLALFLNQMRVTIDSNNSWGGPKEHSGGGRALKHACSIRSKVSYANPYKEFNGGKRDIKKGDKVFGTVIKLDMLKNKLAAPFKVTGFVNMFQDGIDLYTSTVLHALYDLAEAQVLPPVVRGRVEYNGKKLYMADLVNAFREDVAAWEDLKERIRQAQIDIDANVTPDDYAAMQRRSDAADRSGMSDSIEEEE